jgi:hypothetical protein
MQKKLAFIILAIALLFAGFVWWLNLPHTMLIGSWQKVGSSETITFYGDGTVGGSGDDIPPAGTYKILNDHALEVGVGGLGGVLVGQQIFEMQLSNHQLILTGQKQEPQSYSKVQDGSFDDAVRTFISDIVP